MGQQSDSKQPLGVNLVLQGGGAHGAFTWGVLDRLLEDSSLQIEGISATSAGAINAAVLADGFTIAGAKGARASLERFWRDIARAAAVSPLQRGPLDVLLGRWTVDAAPTSIVLEVLSRLFSPCELSTAQHSSLDEVIRAQVNFDRLVRSSIQLFVTATHVRTGQPRLFRNAEITPAVLLASACLPTMFQSVEIDGDAYWDGGFVGSPAIAPLVRACEAQDTIVVQVDPAERARHPRTAREILSRLSEISFNAALMQELRTMTLLQGADDPGGPGAAAWAAMRVHRICNERAEDVRGAPRLQAEWRVLAGLRDCGRQAADRFLVHHAGSLGHASSVDLETLVLPREVFGPAIRSAPKCP